MNNSRRGFLATIAAWLTGLPFVRAITNKPKSFDFHVRFEEIGEERYRATLNCGFKQAIIESPHFDSSHPVEHWAIQARIGLLFEVQRTMKILAFPKDAMRWNSPVCHWFEEGSMTEADYRDQLMKWHKQLDAQMVEDGLKNKGTIVYNLSPEKNS